MKIILLAVLFLVTVNCYDYSRCSSLVPWYGPGNFSTGIFCGNLQNYCQCMYYNYGPPYNGEAGSNIGIANTCTVSCRSAHCDNMDTALDCDIFYKNSANGITMSHLLVFVLIAVLVLFY